MCLSFHQGRLPGCRKRVTFDAMFDLALQLWLGSVDDHIFSAQLWIR